MTKSESSKASSLIEGSGEAVTPLTSWVNSGEEAHFVTLLGASWVENPLVSTELPWGPDNKKQSQISDPGAGLPQFRGRRQLWKVNMGQGRPRHQHDKKFRK